MQSNPSDEDSHPAEVRRRNLLFHLRRPLRKVPHADTHSLCSRVRLQYTSAIRYCVFGLQVQTILAGSSW